MKRRRREATMAGGMKVALLPAVGAGTWSWGAGVVGQCGCFWSSPVALSAAQVPRAAAAKGAGAEGLCSERWSVPRAWAVILLRGRAWCGERILHPWRMGARLEGPRALGRFAELSRIGGA